MKKTQKTKKDFLCLLFILPSLAGMCFFYIVPFLSTLYYSLINNMADKKWAGFKHFGSLFANDLYMQAGRNTLLFILASVPLGMAAALLLVLALKDKKWGKTVLFFLLIPLIVPSGTTIAFWKSVFGKTGLISSLWQMAGNKPLSLENSGWAFAVIVIVFLWKNISFSIVLFWSGINWIPKAYYEQSQIDGATSWEQFKYITWIYLSPTTFVVLLMSIVNSFKVFKEVYMLYGAYPTPSIYMLQHYMNNQFTAMNMQKLSASAWVMFVVLGAMLWIVCKLQCRMTDYSGG